MTSIEPHPCRTRVHWSRSVLLRDVTCGVPDVVWCAVPRAEDRSISSLSGSTSLEACVVCSDCRCIPLSADRGATRPSPSSSASTSASLLQVPGLEPVCRCPFQMPKQLPGASPTSNFEARISHLDPYKSHALAPAGHGILGSNFRPFPADADAKCKPEPTVTARVPDAPAAARPSGPHPQCHNRPRKPEMGSIRSGPDSALPRQG